jgi:hypothetical protein
METSVMDIDTYNNSELQSSTSQQNITTNPISSKHSRTDKLLKQNNILLHTLIIQQKIHFEYEDDQKYTIDKSVSQLAREAKLSLDNLYKSTNAQLKDKTLHIPMAGETEKPKITNFNKEKTEDFV